MTSVGWLSWRKHLCWIIDWMILVLGCLVVPHTHGYLQYVGLIVVGLLLVTLNHAIARNRRRTTDSV